MTQSDPPSLGRRSLLAMAGTAALAGCVSSPFANNSPESVPDDYSLQTPTGSPDWKVPTTSPREVIPQIEVLIENLEIPWDITFTPDGKLFMTERTGSILQFESGTVSSVARPQDAIDAGSVEPGSDKRPWWVKGGEGGTLGIASHPNFPDEPYIYVYYTADGGTRHNRVVRYDVTASDPATTEQPLIEKIPANKYHNGGRIRFGPDGNLWVCTGDAGKAKRAGNLDSLAGKILRVNPEGKPLDSNPDLGGDPRVFTYGHRNPQGIDWLPSGVPIVTEHGPANRDEIQLLRPGGNYGWGQKIRGGPNDPEYASYTQHSSVVPPLVNSGVQTGWAPTGATFYTGETVPAWQYRYLFGGLAGQSIYVLTLTPSGSSLPPTDGTSWRFDQQWTDQTYTATVHRVLHNELGRVRHVTQSPDGSLYAISSNRDGRASGPFPRERDDVLVRLTTN